VPGTGTFTGPNGIGLKIGEYISFLSIENLALPPLVKEVGDHYGLHHCGQLNMFAGLRVAAVPGDEGRARG
jgi:hypothetical protein